ncbi:hypothetical protein GGF45_001648 [Coemansia sp. RSA 551]|nr:hypothetical protein GGF45_001648 [Coemansia sp. RSA 551]
MSNNDQAAAAPQMVSADDFRAMASELFNIQARLERLDQQHVGTKNNVDILLKVVPLFAGNELSLSAVAWETAARKSIADFARGINDHSVVMILKLRLTGPAKTAMAALNLETLDAFFNTLRSMYNSVAYYDLVRKSVESSTFFKVDIDEVTCESVAAVCENYQRAWKIRESSRFNKVTSTAAAPAKTRGQRRRERAAAQQAASTVADSGAEITLVKQSLARKLKLVVRTKSKPELRALWPSAQPYKTLGRTNIQLKVSNGPVRWVKAVVVDFDSNWEVLVGDQGLKSLGCNLMTPAMSRRVPGATVVRDHPGKQLDSVEPAEAPEMAPETVPVEADNINIESVYDTFPDTAPGHDLSTGPAAEPPAAALPAEPVHSRPMRARLGLSVGFFVPGRDADFER